MKKQTADNNDGNGGEVNKLQQHLSLLKEEYKKLQLHSNEIERKYALLNATSGNATENSFVSRLLCTINALYDNSLYSDLNIILPNRVVPAHKIILSARSNHWGSTINLTDVESLDWCEMGLEVGLKLIKWIYTDQVDFTKGEEFTLQLIRVANRYQLDELVTRCEQALMTLVTVKNCVRFYTTADEIGAQSLKQHCSSLISTHWEDFTSEDFVHMSATLLYHMFKNKTKYPLHSAVRLQREDVVFLYLVENNAKLSSTIDELDNRGEIALDLALKERLLGIAVTLLEHNANPDARDAKGWTILHRAVERGDGVAANFLLEHGASISLVTPERGDTALHLIASSAPDTDQQDSDMMSVAKALLGKGLNPNLQNNQGFTPLHLAVMASNEELFDLLLHHDKIDLDARTADGHTPLYYALLTTRNLTNSDSFAARLVDKGAQPNPIYNNNSNSLLHLVADDCLEDAALFICSFANNINHGNRRGETALHVACERGMVNLVKKLLECGANPNVETSLPDSVITGDAVVSSSYKLTPILTAMLNQQDGAVKAFLDYYAAVQNETDNQFSLNLNHRDSKGDSVLSLAVSMEMQHLIPDLISSGADVNIRNGEGLTLLHQAILKSDSKTALFLLSQGANMDTKTQDNLTPLQLAIKCDVPEVIEDLCKKGVDLSVVDENGNCPLWVALSTGKEEIASILVKYGVDTDCWSEGPDGCMQTLLHRAIDENNQVIARFLIQSGCDLNTPRRPGPGGRGGDEAYDLLSPLHLSCSWGLETVVQALIEHGADVNVKDAELKTPLHVAIYNQYAGIVSLLLCHPMIDVSLYERDKSGLTPFATALTCRNDKAAQAILQKLPTAAEQFDNKGRNFLHMAIEKSDLESILFLLSIQVDVNSRVQDSSQTTPLHLAAKTGNEMLVRSFILAGARINDKDGKGQTALHIACEAGHAAVISALLSSNIDYEVFDNEGNNALHIACREGHLNATRVLLSESSIDAEAANLRGRTALHLLAKYPRDNASAICELFVEFMPNYPMDKPDADGNTALILAYMNGNGNLCRTLVKAGAAVGAMNKQGVTIFNYQVATKQLLHRLLDQLSQEPAWIETDSCQECETRFKITMRKHHCRHCGRILCGNCASSDIPILKYNINKPVRVCKTCFDVLHGY